MSEVEKRIEALEAELQQLKNEVKKPEFEVGKWYKNNKNAIINYQNNTGRFICGYGFNEYGYWCSGGGWSYELKNFIPATDKEVEEALINEAKKRGFKEGVKIDRKDNEFSPNKGKTTLDLIIDPLYLPRFNRLEMFGSSIFEKGKWAEIIKEEKIEIGGYEVKFSPENNYTIIDGNRFTKEFWESAKVISEHSLETINKILSKL